MIKQALSVGRRVFRISKGADLLLASDGQGSFAFRKIVGSGWEIVYLTDEDFEADDWVME